MKDPIIQEVRRIRKEQAAKVNYNVDAFFDALQEREKTCGHKVVDLSKKRKVG